jgi:hypothetical protein
MVDKRWAMTSVVRLFDNFSIMFAIRDKWQIQKGEEKLCNDDGTIIKDYKLAEKRKIQLPDFITGIFKCPNLRCVTIGENIKSVIEVIDKEKIILKCNIAEEF